MNLLIQLLPTIDAFCLPCRSQLPDRSCVYFLIDSHQKVVYVGATKSLLKRWPNQHHWKYKLEKVKGLRIGWLLVSIEDLSTFEIAYLKVFQPKFNVNKSQGYPRIKGVPTR